VSLALLIPTLPVMFLRPARFALRRCLAAAALLCGLGWPEAQARPSATLGTPQGTEIGASDPGLFDHFGRALDVSGNTAIVTSRYDEHSGLGFAGSAYVLVSNGGVWTEQAKLIAGDPGLQDLFGHSAAISGDTVILGARNADHSGLTDAGAAYIFVRTGTSWSQQAKLTASDAAEFDHFGISVEVFGDTAIVGAALDDHVGGVDAGSAYVFVRSGTTWIQQAKLTAGDGAAEDFFGWKAALHGDRALIGAHMDDSAAGPDAGSVYCFMRTGDTWSPVGQLLASDGAEDDQFGTALEVSGDLVAIGSPRDDHTNGVDAGSTYIFGWAGGNWTQLAKLVPGDSALGDNFGHVVALSGNTLLVGAPQAQVAGINAAGAAYAFTGNGANWSESVKLVQQNPTLKENLGSSLGLAGGAALIGMPHRDFAGLEDSGAVLAFALPTDCNSNGVPDDQDLALGTSTDCNQNGIPDECDILAGTSLDLDDEGTPDTCQALSASGPALSISVGGTLSFDLHAGASHAGELYLLLGSLSGTLPGIPIDGQVLALNPDAYFFLTLSGGPPLQGSIGLLDAAGAGSASLVLPPGAISPSLAGAVVFHAYASVSTVSLVVTLTSNPIPTALWL
jgi:FG-GAP repeat